MTFRDISFVFFLIVSFLIGLYANSIILNLITVEPNPESNKYNLKAMLEECATGDVPKEEKYFISCVNEKAPHYKPFTFNLGNHKLYILKGGDNLAVLDP